VNGTAVPAPEWIRRRVVERHHLPVEVELDHEAAAEVNAFVDPTRVGGVNLGSGFAGKARELLSQRCGVRGDFEDQAPGWEGDAVLREGLVRVWTLMSARSAAAASASKLSKATSPAPSSTTPPTK